MPATGAHALSDAEYKTLMQSSPEFRQAEARLAQAWKRAFASVKSREGMARRELLDSQRDWIARIRDAEAKACMDRGMPRSKAYATATLERAAYLESFVR